ALEVPVQRSLILRAAYLVIGPREVIQPDVAITRLGQLVNRGSEDAKFLQSLGQESREAPLLFLHPRHVSVTEHRDSIRIHLDNLVNRIGEALSRLMWQPVDQIDVDALESDFAAIVEQLL